MALSEENGMVMPVSPMYGGGGGFGNGNGMGGDGWWILLLFILLGAGNWGGNRGGFGGGNGGSFAYTDIPVQAGFNQAALTSGIGDIQTSLNNGFSNVQQSLCNGFAGVNATVNGGFANLEASNNARQIADMQQMFALQTQLANCCCENRAGIADLRYTVATENCADRAVISDGIRDLLTAQNANTQRILDQMCNDKIDAKNEKIADLERQLTMANLSASQIAQTAQIQRGQVAEVDALYQRLKDCPVPTMPVYGSQPIFTCPNNNGCGCGCNGGF